MSLLSALSKGRAALGGNVARNVVANYLATAWMGIVGLALIPVYFDRLGAAQWGLVAVCMTIQALANILDLGMSQVMPRDIARVAGDAKAETKVFRIYASAFAGIGATCFVVGQLLAGYILDHWINRGEGAGEGARLALGLAFVQFMFQFANGAHLGYWNGLQQQIRANARQCTFATLKHAATLASLTFWTPTAIGYLAPFAAVSALEWAANRWAITHSLGFEPVGRVGTADLRWLSKNVGAIALSVLIGMLVSQIDRLILSRELDIAVFGQYVLITTVGLAFLQLQYPLMRALFPSVVQETVRRGGRHRLIGVFVLCVLPCLLAGIFADPLLAAWIGAAQMPANGPALLRLILAAVCINATYHLIYLYILKDGAGGLLVTVNLVALVVAVAVLLLCVDSLGIVAGGLAWLANALVQLSFGLHWIAARRPRHLLPNPPP